MSKKEKISLNEFIHTNQKSLLVRKKVKLLNDEMQIHHYTMWNYDYKAESSEEFGHGDIAIANGYALLPLNYKAVKKTTNIITNIGKEIDNLPTYEVGEVDWGD